jgi:hypothetical protein
MCPAHGFMEFRKVLNGAVGIGIAIVFFDTDIDSDSDF